MYLYQHLQVGDLTKSFETTIVVKKAFMVITKVTKSMKVGEEFDFDVDVKGYSSDRAKYSTQNKSIVTIDKRTGKATAETRGTDYVVIKCGPLTKKIMVTVD